LAVNAQTNTDTDSAQVEQQLNEGENDETIINSQATTLSNDHNVHDGVHVVGDIIQVRGRYFHRVLTSH
jgi:hypothetical protein